MFCNSSISITSVSRCFKATLVFKSQIKKPIGKLPLTLSKEFALQMKPFL